MKTKYFVDSKGNYLGAFTGSEPKEATIEVPEAPDDARQKWNGKSWGAPAVPYAERRRKALPSVGDQLDMQYWDAVNGTTHWVDLIASVKQANPKPV